MSLSTLSNIGLSEADATHRRIGATYIVEFGIIKEVVSDGVVTVEMATAKDKKSIVVTNCILASFASSSLTVNIKPNKDDKVLVLFPKGFSSKMFSEDQKEVIVSEATEGYCLLGGIAILLNQFQGFHKNYLDLSDGCIDLKMAYSKEEDKNLLSLVTNADGEIELNTNDNILLSTNKDGEITFSTNENITLTTNKDGEISLNTNDNITVTTNKDGEVSVNCNNKFKEDINKDGELSLDINGKFTEKVNKDGELAITSGNTTVDIKKNGEVKIDNSKATVTIDSSGNVKVETSGKYTFKNNSTNLKDVIDGVAKEIENLTTVGSPATQATSPASKATIATWRSTKLNLLLG